MTKRGRQYPALAERLAAKTCKEPGLGPNGDCWEWSGSVCGNGYGQLSRGKADGGRVDYAHRVAFELHYGMDIGRARDTGVLVLHHCDNRKCVNPVHLFLGSAADNHRDMTNKGRRVIGDQRGDANPSSKLTASAVRALRSGVVSPQQIAEQFGVTEPWAVRVKSGDAWRHIKP